MSRRVVVLACALLSAACRDHPTFPTLDGGCWLMSVDGAEPRTALLRLTNDIVADTTNSRRHVWPSPRILDRTITGTWRYAYHTTDSLYVSLGNSARGYGLWLRRVNTTTGPATFTGIVAAPATYMGGASVFLYNRTTITTAQLTQASCRD